MTNEELAYAAGIMDGEGSISLVKTKQRNKPPKYLNHGNLSNPNGINIRYVLSVNVGMVDRQVPEWLYEQFGGHLYYRKGQKEGWSNQCIWQITSRLALSFLEQVFPYLKVKRVQAKIAIDFQRDRKVGVGLMSIEKQADTILYEAMRRLNQRGKVENAITA